MLAITKEERKLSIKWPRRKGEEDGQDGEAGRICLGPVFFKRQ
jgi:hypothetical protein